MNRSWLAALSLAPLLGASQTLLQASAMAGLTLSTVLVHLACMTPLRRWLDGVAGEITSILVAATLVTCQTLALHAWGLELRNALGVYPELIALQCLLFEQSVGKAGRRAFILLGGFCVLYLLLGTIRELLASGALNLTSISGPDITGLRLASLAPGALLLLGVLLALIKRACPKQATPDREGNS
ncbi:MULTISPECIES: Rnf-Nqr domain containing protein [unclassified Pseudomonas]|uniref:Rnf-Nqr domain containing protein n=1 Tax=unclassified Pseudomonas TaxID=196821 RepID=UPI0021C7F129|nr:MULTISPECIES: Rnf-Nqr domain containing protein [unclassified Pseudomonas]MCU1721268.1 NADH:quinone oxidoreductase [Pseudomonas sp. 5P_5.1_Bac1]MCU1732133.1 NADH:quinone oxidoreductase [Pseudomonas sp. 20P_3.2_Bac4]MCU1744802.1 NADH:quinone oxidoreductase [Pseudomonas sp. 20P_3.2_Bac5]